MLTVQILVLRFAVFIKKVITNGFDVEANQTQINHLSITIEPISFTWLPKHGSNTWLNISL